PPTGRLGIVHSSLRRRRRPKLSNPPTGRLGIVHSSLRRRRRLKLSNPPTGRLGIVHSSLRRRRRPKLSNPPTGRLGIVHSSLRRRRRPKLPNPPTGRLGIVHSNLQRSLPSPCLKSPNREVGDRSFQPTKIAAITVSQIPQPGGWGSFIPAYKDRCHHRVSNPPTGRLGIVHSSLQRSLPSPCLKSPNREVGDRSFQPMSRHSAA